MEGGGGGGKEKKVRSPGPKGGGGGVRLQLLMQDTRRKSLRCIFSFFFLPRVLAADTDNQVK